MTMMVLLEGFFYALVLSSIVTVSQLFNPRLWLSDYPKEIQKMVPQTSRMEKIAKCIIGVPFLLFMFGYPIYSTLELKTTLGMSFTILSAFFNTLIICSIFNLFDLLILDWLIFCHINPRYLTLKGTEDHKAYKDYAFHFRAARKGFRISVLFSALVSIFLSI